MEWAPCASAIVIVGAVAWSSCRLGHAGACLGERRGPALAHTHGAPRNLLGMQPFGKSVGGGSRSGEAVILSDA